MAQYGRVSTVMTARLSLVRWNDEHLADLLVLAKDERIVRYIIDGRPWTPEYTAERHRAVLAHWERHGYGWRAVLDTDSGEFVGVASLTHREADKIELGWWVAPAAWGRGIATELAAAIRDEAMAQPGVRCVVAQYQDGNAASGRVMVKIGLVHHHSDVDATQAGRLVHVYVGYSKD